MTICKSCGAEIFWRNTPSGRAIPIDIQKRILGGNIILIGLESCEVVGPGAGEYVSHFATCPNAKKHRKQKQ